ncbi:MAG: sodium:solute symporter, partial [Bacteroidota bacterium]
MSIIDWIVLGLTITFIVVYGTWKSRGARSLRGYVLSNNDTKWWVIGLSVMATQASAITFLSTPGQAFADGMRFVQFYLGVPIAMVVISVVAIPIYHQLKVYTAYEYLETRFDLKTRSLIAFLFLVSRSLAAGLTIYAPAIILSVLLGWNVFYLCVVIGLVVTAYTLLGGTKAVNVTHIYQMAIILIGMVVAGVIMVMKLPEDISFGDAFSIAGAMGKFNSITVPSLEEFDLKDKYNLFSGLLGGTFLALAYFGTDQSQVQRYLSGRSVTESRLGLMFNGIFKVPMQFFILFLGVMMFVFFQFDAHPLFFNEQVRSEMTESKYGEEFSRLEEDHKIIQSYQQPKYRELLAA